MFYLCFFKKKTADKCLIIDWSSDVCSSDLLITARHDPQRILRIRGLYLGQGVAISDPIERFGLRLVRHAQTTADIDERHATDRLGHRRQLRVHLTPVPGIEDAAADMRMQADDARRDRVGGGDRKSTRLNSSH